MKRKFSALLAILCAVSVALLSGCANAPPPLANKLPGDAALLSGLAFGGRATAPLPATGLLAVNDEMREFLRQHVPTSTSDKRKVELILQAILDDGLKLQYDLFETYTAEEAFYAREGNCLSFTNLFVALAREAGVRTHYQQVEVPATWSSYGDTFLFNLHINALVDLPGHEQVVDFNIAEYRPSINRQRLRDAEAESQYHNNMGVHWLRETDYAQSFRHFRRALKLAPRSDYIWSNLGTLYRRVGHWEEAEAAYRKAIRLGGEYSAMSNLARLYQEQGSPERAGFYEEKVALFRNKNPYFLHHLAVAAYTQGDFQTALSYSRKAIAREKYDHKLYQQLGLTYVQLGYPELAVKHFTRAAELSDGPDLRRYNRKLGLLAGF